MTSRLRMFTTSLVLTTALTGAAVSSAHAMEETPGTSPTAPTVMPAPVVEAEPTPQPTVPPTVTPTEPARVQPAPETTTPAIQQPKPKPVPTPTTSAPSSQNPRSVDTTPVQPAPNQNVNPQEFSNPGADRGNQAASSTPAPSSNPTTPVLDAGEYPEVELAEGERIEVIDGVPNVVNKEGKVLRKVFIPGKSPSPSVSPGTVTRVINDDGDKKPVFDYVIMFLLGAVVPTGLLIREKMTRVPVKASSTLQK